MWNKALFVSYVCHFRRRRKKKHPGFLCFHAPMTFHVWKVLGEERKEEGGTWIIQSLTDFVYGHHYPLPRHCRKYLLRVPLFPFPRFLYFFSSVIKLRSTLRSSNSSCIKFLLPQIMRVFITFYDGRFLIHHITIMNGFARLCLYLTLWLSKSRL